MRFRLGDNVDQGGSDSHDLELDRLVRNGDAEALALLYQHYHSRLQKIVATRLDSRLKGRVDPSDVLQEAFVDLAHRLPNFSKRVEKMSIFVWMRLVATERLLNIHREHLDAAKRDARRERPMPSINNSATSICLANNMMAQMSSADGKVIRSELKAILMNTIGSMDPIDQEIILLRGFESLSNAEAAEVLGMSANGASNRYVRAMARLHTELKSIPGFMD